MWAPPRRSTRLGSKTSNGLARLTKGSSASAFNVGYDRNNGRPRYCHAQREYTTGREVLISYLTKLPQTNNHFLQALEATTHFEQCIASACQAANLFKSIVKLAAAPEVQDDRHRRLIAIWNRSKHFDEDITNPRRPEWGDAEIIAPVWLTNEGVSCADASITFEELHSFLIDLQNLFKSFAELPTP